MYAARYIYVFFRLIYISFWFYFAPYTLSLVQFILPLVTVYSEGILPEAPAEDDR